MITCTYTQAHFVGCTSYVASYFLITNITPISARKRKKSIRMPSLVPRLHFPAFLTLCEETAHAWGVEPGNETIECLQQYIQCTSYCRHKTSDGY